jgi:hypothetical protein
LVKFRFELEAAENDVDLSSAVAVVHSAGGTEVSVLQTAGKPHVEFTVEAENERRAALAGGLVCRELTNATHSLVGSWSVVSLHTG